MPAELFHKSVNLDYLYPPFLEALLNLITECKMLGAPYKVYSGHRSYAEQVGLYEIYLKGGARAAPPGMSAHNYGLAVDCAFLKPNGQLSWLSSDYGILNVVVEKHGLMSGKLFGDNPHVQWPKYVTGFSMWPLKSVYHKTTGTELEKLKAVWAFIDKGKP